MIARNLGEEPAFDSFGIGGYDEQTYIDEHELLRDICKDSFYEFLVQFWDVFISDPPVWNWHIKFLCDELQRAAERVFDRLPAEYDLVVNVPPGTTKSTIFSVVFPAWAWTIQPGLKFICASYSHTLALDLALKSRDIVISEKYKDTFPNVRIRSDQNSKGHFATTKGGFRYAVGIGGSVTGMHGHFILIDDPLNPQEAVSEASLATANNWMSRTIPTRRVDKQVTFTGLIMQRLHQNDPTGARLSMYADEKRAGKGVSRHVRHICLPAELNSHVRPMTMRARYVNGLLDPIRLNRKAMAEQYIKLGEFGYAGQFNQHPVPEGGGTFKVQRLTIDDPPPVKDFVEIIRYWDKAGTGGKGMFTVGCKMGRDKSGRFWILDIVRGQWEAHEREKRIKFTAELDGKGVRIGAEQEPGSGGLESAQATVRNLAGYRVRIDKPVGDKVMRADPFASQVNGGNVYLARGEWNYVYIQELTYFPFSTYKDQVDASTGGFAQLMEKKIKIGALRSA